MALIPCGECGASVSTLAAACPKCGAPVVVPASIASTSKGPLWPWVLIAVIGGGVLLWSIGSTPGARERGTVRLAIENCWKEQKRPSMDPATARFLASTCERMENDFTSKYGVKP